MAEKQAVKYSTPDKLTTEAKKYKSAEEFFSKRYENEYKRK